MCIEDKYFKLWLVFYFKISLRITDSKLKEINKNINIYFNDFLNYLFILL